MERIAIFAALRRECQPVLRHMHQVARGRVGDFAVWSSASSHHEIVLVQTGVGLTRAAAAARVIGETGQFALFVSTGCAGALSPELAPGDVAVATEVVANPSGGRFETHREHRVHVQCAAARAALRVTSGPVLCSPHVLATAEGKRSAAAEHGAIAVEMEGAPIAAQAAQRSIPFVSVRAILDTAATELRHAGRFIEPQTGAVKPLALAAYLATHPGAVSDLLAMLRMMKAAQTSLERFFGAWFALPFPPPSTGGESADRVVNSNFRG